jgi:hypothetical protein
VYSGPVLAADPSGAWLVAGEDQGKGVLVHVPVQGRRREYPLDVAPTGVAVGGGSVWVVGQARHDDEVLRIDPADGRVAAKEHFPAAARIDSIAFGYGHVWVVSSTRSMLYRIDPQFRRSPRGVRVAHSSAARPEILTDYVWVVVNAGNGTGFWFDPWSLQVINSQPNGGPPDTQDYAWDGSLWWYDPATGTAYQQNGEGAPILPITVTSVPPPSGGPPESGPCLTSITTAGGGVWLAVSDEPAGDCGS